MERIFDYITSPEFLTFIITTIILTIAITYYVNKFYDRRRPIIEKKELEKRKKGTIKKIMAFIYVAELNTYPERYDREQSDRNSHWLKSILGFVIYFIYGGGIERLYPLTIFDVELVDKLITTTILIAVLMFGGRQAGDATRMDMRLKKAKRRQVYIDRINRYKAKEDKQEAKQQLEEYDMRTFGIKFSDAEKWFSEDDSTNSK